MSAREENIRVRIEAVSDLPDLASQMEELIRLTKQQQEITQQSALAARTGAIQQVTAIEGVTDALRKQQTESDKAGKTTTDSNDKVGKSFEALSGQVRSFTSLLATAFTIDRIKAFGEDIIDAKTKIDSFKISLDTMLGSKKASADLYAQLVVLAKQTPYSLEEVVEQTTKLAAYNIATADLIPTITNLGNAAAAVGKEKLPQITLAYGQIMNMGKLMGAETRQLIESGIDIYGMLSVSLGKTKEEVQKMAAEHTIMASDVKKAFEVASAAGGRFADMMVNQSKTVGGQISNISDAFFVAKGKIGDFFEDSIRSGSRYMGELITAMGGSNSAIQRTTNLIATLVSGFATYQLATNAVAIKEGVLAAAMVVKNAAVTAGNLIVGTYNLAMISAVGSTDAFTSAQVRSAAAARTTWTSMGPLVAILGVAFTAYMAYKTASEEVTSAIGEQQIALQKEQKDVQLAVEGVLKLEEGTTRRKKAMQDLINQYPDYFAGLSAEYTNNATLKEMLEKVNGSYKTRIALAKEAYRTELIEDQFKKVVELEDKVMKIAEDRLGKEFMVQIGGDPTKLLTALNKSSVQMDAFAGNGVQQFKQLFDGLGTGMEDALKKVINGNANYEREKMASDGRVKALQEKSNTELLALEEDRHKQVTAQLKAANDGSAKDQAEFNTQMAAEEKRYQDHLIGIKGTSQKAQMVQLADHAEKTKQVILLTDKEIAVIKGESNQTEEVDRTKQLQNQLAFLGKQEDAEIESVKKITVNKNTSNAALAALQEQARLKALAIDAKYDLKRSIIIEELEVEEQKNFLLKVQESNDKVAVLTAKRLEAERMLTKLNDAATNDERLAALSEYNQKFTENLQQQGLEQLKIQADNSKKALDKIATESGEKGDAYRKAYAAWLKDNEQYETALTQQRITATKETAESIQKSEKEIQDAHRETAKAEEDTLKRTNQTRKEFLTGLASLVSQDGGFLGQIGAGLVSLYNGIDGMQTKALAGAKSALKGAEDNLAVIKGMYSDSTAAGAAAIAKGEEDVAKAKGAVADAEAVTVTGVLGVMGAIYGVFSAIAAAYNNMMAETYKAIAEGLGRAREAYSNFYDFVEKHSKDAFEEEMKNFNGSLDERIKRINEYYANEKTLIEGRDRIDAQLAYSQQIAQIQADAGTNAGKIMEGIIKAEEDQATRKYQLEINKANVAIEQAARVRDETLAIIDQQLTDFKRAKNQEIDALKNSETEQLNAVKTASDEKIKRQNDELTNFKNNLDSQIAALTDNLNRQKELLGIASSDDQIRLTADDVFRKQLMDAGEIREVAALEAAKQRELARTTDAGERTRIINAFELLIKEKHAEYQTAIGDKSKEVSLATKEVKAQESVDIKNIELDTTTKINDLKDQILTKQKTTAAEIAKIQTDAATETSRIQKETYDLISKIQLDIANQEYQSQYQRKLAQEDYAKARDASEKQIFLNEKALMVAQLQAEIAVLNAKKNIFNEGAIIDAVGKIERSIADINGLAYASSTPGVGGKAGFIQGFLTQLGLGLDGLPTKPTRLDTKQTIDRAYDAKGNFMEITYNPTGKVIKVYDKDGNAFDVAYANGYVPATGERLFKGSPYVEGLGYPDGRDTVPAMINKGERVLSTADNLAIGGRDLTNESLVQKVKYVDLLTARYPQYQMPQQMNFGQLRLPAEIMNQTNTNALDISKLHAEVKGLRGDIKNQKLVSINMDEQGFTKSIIGIQSKINHMTNRFTR